jgi:hypothetical protein
MRSSHELAQNLLSRPDLPVHLLIVDMKNPPESGFVETTPVTTVIEGENRDDKSEAFILIVGDRTKLGSET